MAAADQADINALAPGWWEGEWVEDERHGVGRLYRADGTLELQARWAHNRVADTGHGHTQTIPLLDAMELPTRHEVSSGEPYFFEGETLYQFQVRGVAA
jgi:hypothetical protein